MADDEEQVPGYVRDESHDTRDPDEVREELVLRPSGTIHLWVDGKRFRLRRPRLGEYRRLREQFEEVADDVSDAADEAFREQAAVQHAQQLRAEGESASLGYTVVARPTPEERATIRASNRRLAEVRERLHEAWWQAVLDTLAVDDARPPELAVWMLRSESCGQVFKHWQAVPSPSGVR